MTEHPSEGTRSGLRAAAEVSGVSEGSDCDPRGSPATSPSPANAPIGHDPLGSTPRGVGSRASSRESSRTPSKPSGSGTPRGNSKSRVIPHDLQDEIARLKAENRALNKVVSLKEENDTLRRLRVENEMLRKTVEELRAASVVKPQTIGRENEVERDLSRQELVPRDEDHSGLFSKVKRGLRNFASSEYGPGKLRHAPRDLLIIYTAKGSECVAYYGIAYIYIQWMSEEVGLSDEMAGAVYAFYGALCTIFGFVAGPMIDRLGVHKSLMIGTSCATAARLIWCITTNEWWVIFVSLTICPFGAAFGIPVMAICVRRYTHVQNRAFAYSFFYVVLCIGCIGGSMIINAVREAYPDGITVGKSVFSWMDIVFVVCTCFSFYTVIAAYFIRDIQVLSDQPLKDRAYCVFVPNAMPLVNMVKDCAGQPRFWRLFAVTFIFCGVRTTFRHLDATFPKYFVRIWGVDAPFEIYVALNPVITMALTPIMTGVLLKCGMGLQSTLLLGSLLSGLSVFSLALSESQEAAIGFVFMLSLGESIWSPKLYEFSTMTAPEGGEGMYVALTFAPLYMASFFTGFLSGWALQRYCPKDHPELRNTRLMWFIIGLTAFISPVILYMTRSCLFVEEDEKRMHAEDEEPEGEQRGTSRLPPQKEIAKLENAE